MTPADFKIHAWMILLELRMAARETARPLASPTRLTPEFAADVADVLEAYITGDVANLNQAVSARSEAIRALMEKLREHDAAEENNPIARDVGNSSASRATPKR